MKISSKGRYAVRLMVDIAKNDTNEYVSIKDIAERQNISLKYLEQITRILSKGKLLSSARGSLGGYKLARPADSITVAEILLLTEKDISPVQCVHGKKSCPNCNKCETISCWEKLNTLIQNYLNSVSIQDLIDKKC